MDVYDACACGHLLNRHFSKGFCSTPGCKCTRFTDPATAQSARRNRRGDRASDEKRRRIQVLRQHLLPVITQLQSEGEIRQGSSVATALVDRVESFVLRASATECFPDKLVKELSDVLAQPIDQDGDSFSPVMFPHGVAKGLLDVIADAAHHAHDTVFQEIA